MATTLKGKLRAPRAGVLLAAGMLAAGLFLAGPPAYANPINVSASVGGVPTGTSYENFDSLALGNAGGTTASGIKVSFTGTGQAVQGSQADVYAAPFLSNGNGALFGDSNNGPDATTFLTTGIGIVTLLFPALEKYMGILWGSVDGFNALSFYNGNDLVGSITGNDVTALANGNRGEQGTLYVNINSLSAFDRVVATSTQYAFEFDNVAFNPKATGVPEPGAAGIFLLGLALVGSGCWFRRRQTA